MTDLIDRPTGSTGPSGPNGPTGSAAAAPARPAPIRRAWALHQSGRRDLAHELWDVIALQAWIDRWMPGMSG